MTEDLKTALITWPRAPYECGSAQGWMQKAHDRIVELEKALRVTQLMISGESIENAVIDTQTMQSLGNAIEVALQPKAGS